MANNIKELLSGIKENWGKRKLFIWALGLAGVLMIVLPGNCQPREQLPPNTMTGQDNYQQQLQKELEGILSGIDGVGRVRVMLTLDDEQEIIYAINEETSHRNTNEVDSQGGYREQVEYDHRGQLVIVRTNNQEQPVVIKVIRPRVRGVLVVATGADSPLVRQRLTHAVQGVLDLPAYRITIQKGQ